MLHVIGLVISPKCFDTRNRMMSHVIRSSFCWQCKTKNSLACPRPFSPLRGVGSGDETKNWLTCPLVKLSLDGHVCSSRKCGNVFRSALWYTSIGTANPPLLLNHLWYCWHCTAPCCSFTGFYLSSVHFCLALSLSLLNLVEHTSHTTSLATAIGAHAFLWLL